ncbi:Gfo/Idh/MocA family oxidoreductase [uncultured Gimesia sp.]|uniref:Gfo/Idh/MocA family protein n=1 Tax=uncultured Gimesia sp. TaxID=1678688 RepID=UPI00262E62CB|nr:Gfo/Idh/MocA family oxidoreductase [uncultured Gimesia sp.]
MSRLNRREFLGAVPVVYAGMSSLSQAAVSPNEKVNVALVGCGGRGRGLGSWFAKLPDSQLVAVCDPDESRSGQMADQIEKSGVKRPKLVEDFRSLLDGNEIDAIVIATPDHWHTPAAIMACQAGKDVYVEKPCSHNIHEGRQLVNAARKYKRVVQHGTNLRATPVYQQAWKQIQDGAIGKVMMVKAINNQRRALYPPRPDEPVPSGVNYDLWLGPAQKRPFNKNCFHTSWHWNWDFGTGDIGNDGVHQIDIGRWGMNLKAPNAVSCSGAKLGSKGDAQETPDTMVVTWEYDDLLYVYEQRDFTPYRLQAHRHDNDNIFYGDKGFMMVDRTGYRIFYKHERAPAFEEKWQDTPTHYQNFIDCVKSRNSQDLLAEIEEGHYSALLSHLGNISYRTGRRLVFDPKTETFPEDKDANQYLTRNYRDGYELPQV